MKKSIIAICLVLTGVGFMALSSRGDEDTTTKKSTPEEPRDTPTNHITLVKANPQPLYPDFFIEVDNRFIHTVTKEELHSAESILELVPEQATTNMATFHHVQVSVMTDEGDLTELGNSGTLNEAQLALLRKADYSTDFHVHAAYANASINTVDLNVDELVYYVTVTPEQEAKYIPGKEALHDYLTVNSREASAYLGKYDLQPAQIRFTVSTEGVVDDAKLEATSGYKQLDKTMLKLIQSLPGKWQPASDASGNPVAQELVFFFGNQGC